MKFTSSPTAPSFPWIFISIFLLLIPALIPWTWGYSASHKNRPRATRVKTEGCGGTLVGSSGQFNYEKQTSKWPRSINGNRNCIWILRPSTNVRSRPGQRPGQSQGQSQGRVTGIVVSVEKLELSRGSTVSFYPERELNSESNHPRSIRLDSSDVSRVTLFRVEGEMLVVILSALEEDQNFSLQFHWDFEYSRPKKCKKNCHAFPVPRFSPIATTANFLSSAMRGDRIYWHPQEFQLRQKSIWVLNVVPGPNGQLSDLTSSSTLSHSREEKGQNLKQNERQHLKIQLTVKILDKKGDGDEKYDYADDSISNSEEEMLEEDPCERISYRIFEVRRGGRLRRIVTHCQGTLDFSAPNLSSQLLTFVRINSTADLGVPIKFVKLQWETQLEGGKKQKPNPKLKISTSTIPPVTSPRITSTTTTTTTTTETTVQTSSSTTEIPFTLNLGLGFDEASLESTMLERCPKSALISPCTCSIFSGLLQIDCYGNSVNQGTIDNLFAMLRKENNVSSADKWIRIGKLRIHNTRIYQLDLLPFLGLDLKILDISWNTNFFQFVVAGRPLPVQVKQKGHRTGRRRKIKKGTKATASQPSFKSNSDSDSNYSSTPTLKSPDLIPAPTPVPDSNQRAQRPLIRAKTFRLVQNPRMTNVGLGGILNLFSPMMEELILFKNDFTETMLPPNSNINSKRKIVQEFLPGLSSLTNLTGLYLNYNRIRKLGRAQFFWNTKLAFLGLGGNGIDQIEEQAFLFHHQTNESCSPGQTFKIDLSQNLLNGSNFPGELGLHSVSRPVFLDLDENQFKTIPYDKFYKFLLLNDRRNQMSVRANAIRCNSSNGWLKRFREILGNSVHHAVCTNEVGKTVFTSSYY